ncbi:hypothetical protein N665_0433s0010 [Sinapis alba]|nr:hypothetical protein N665_0433s0010 [Sinapis alba]KAF8091842.1 hypothetical protein N665_0433s0010 [Sinapis alba]
MQGERASLGYLSEALNFEHGSTSSNGVIDHWDNDLQDYMIANSEPVYHEQHDLQRFSLGEASSSGTKNEAPSSSHNEQRRNEIIDLDSDSEQPSGSPNQHVQNVNVNPIRDGSGFLEANGPFQESSVTTGSSSVSSCKIKAFEGSIGQSSSGGLNISGPRGQVSGTVPNFSVSETSERSGTNPNVFSAISIPPVSRNMLPPFQWTEVSLAGGSSTSVERNLHLDETRPRSIPESPLFIPAPPELRNVSPSATSGNLNLASSVSRTGVQPPAWTPYQNLPHQQRRRSELARRSLISSLAGSGDHPTLPSLAPPDGPVLQPGGDNSQMPYSRAGLWLDGQGDSAHSFRALAAASRGRSRLTVSQMQNILDVMRRDPNHNLRLEDVMLLNQSLLFDGTATGMHDRYRDMRLDVDNMSYEELLALEERIGDVCTGVNEETISNRLKQRKFKSSTKSPQDAEPCCICQEEYSEGEDMGTLECGHDFHSQCIKEWLKHKNLCPICKTTGLNTAKKRKIG